ncbi:MAG: hypothetical protein ABEJ22_01705 [Haloferacaceae archaeon]
MRGRTLLVALVLSTVVASAAAPPTAAADAPQTVESCNDALTALRGLAGSPAFDDYSEFEVIRSQAVTQAQVGTCDDGKVETLGAVVAVLRSFTGAYRASENGSAAQALEGANATRSHIQTLRSQGVQQYVALSQLALDRFYSALGDKLAARAREATRTPDEIDRLGLAATAYKQAGSTQRFSKLTVRMQDLSAQFSADMDAVDDTTATTKSFLASCSACSSPAAAAASPVETVRKYARVRRLQSRLGTASDRLESHGLDPDTRDVATLRERVSSSLLALAAGAALFLLGFTLVVALLAAVVAWRVGLWERDLTDARVDEIVLTGGFSE